MRLKSSDVAAAKNTEKLLRLISSHVQGRTETQHVEYRVIIEDDSPVLLPYVWVYPSRYSRKKETREDVVSHILNRHLDTTEHNFVSGEYVYQFSLNNKRRRWIHTLLIL